MASVRFTNSQEICRNRNHPIAGRSPQMLECNSCLFYVHRTCLPEKGIKNGLYVYLSLLKVIILGISSTEYVRLKKQKEAFHFKCNPCSNVEEFVHLGIGNGRDIDQPVASSSSVEADVDEPPASSSRVVAVQEPWWPMFVSTSSFIKLWPWPWTWTKCRNTT